MWKSYSLLNNQGSPSRVEYLVSLPLFIVSRLDEMDQYLNDGHDGDIGYSIHIDCKEHLEIWIEFNLIFDDNDKLCVKSVQGRVPWSTEDIDAYNTKGRRKASTLPGFNWKLE